VDLRLLGPLEVRLGAVRLEARVGNVTHHAQWTTLLDQMWVRP
jgi:hypothetical protein